MIVEFTGHIDAGGIIGHTIIGPPGAAPELRRTGCSDRSFNGPAAAAARQRHLYDARYG
jgi:hypothetical protein